MENQFITSPYTDRVTQNPGQTSVTCIHRAEFELQTLSLNYSSHRRDWQWRAIPLGTNTESCYPWCGIFWVRWVIYSEGFNTACTPSLNKCVIVTMQISHFNLNKGWPTWWHLFYYLLLNTAYTITHQVVASSWRLTSESCWAVDNKASVIKLVNLYSNVTSIFCLRFKRGWKSISKAFVLHIWNTCSLHIVFQGVTIVMYPYEAGSVSFIPSLYDRFNEIYT